MKKINFAKLSVGALFVVLFLLWTASVQVVDVQAVGPLDSCVGFARLNVAFHSITGVNMSLYDLTDWLSVIPIVVVMAFALLGLCQWISRKSILQVDKSLVLLGVFYVVVMLVFCLFEVLVINYRPVLINEILEASYPSSTTLLTMCVMPTCAIQLNHRIKNTCFKITANVVIYLFTAFMVIARLVSGVHWLTDIIGGFLFSIGVVLLYSSIVNAVEHIK